MKRAARGIEVRQQDEANADRKAACKYKPQGAKNNEVLVRKKRRALL